MLEKDNIANINILKVGHNRFKTSSDREFIDEINFKY